MTKEEFVDFYVEGSFALRDSEVQFKLELGKMLLDKNESEIKELAKAIKRHVSFLLQCKAVAEKWNELERTYDKSKSWSDLVKEAGFEKEKRSRKPIKSIIEKRLRENEERFKQTGDVYVKGKLDEDKELLTKGDE
jgi:hypothetical protein